MELPEPECPVCLQSYDGASTVPRVLACGHTACESCLVSLPLRYPDTIRCPACTQLVKYPAQGPSGLPKNIDLLRLRLSLSVSPNNPSSDSNSRKAHSELRNEHHQFVPHLWSDEFYATWKDWILPQDSLLVEPRAEEEDDRQGLYCLVLRGRTSLTKQACVAENQRVSLLRLVSLASMKDSVIRYSYIMQVMNCLIRIKAVERNELRLILGASVKHCTRVNKIYGLWGNSEDGFLYLVSERGSGSLLEKMGHLRNGFIGANEDGLDKDGLPSFAMIGMEMCEVVVALHLEGLIVGCLGLSCFSIDEFGHVHIDLNEVLAMGRNLCRAVARPVSDGRAISDREMESLVIDLFTSELLVSPELLSELLQGEGIVLDSGTNSYTVGNAEALSCYYAHGEQKGAQLLKYGPKGKPKFCPFRLSNDESSLIWISTSGERSLKLASVSRIIPGQRTAVFQRYLRPEKDYLSFSLIYNNGQRSLDLICKDKVEAEAWIAGLKALISSGQGGRSKIDGWSDGGLYFDDSRDLTSNSPSDSSISATRSPEVSTSINPNNSPKSFRPDSSVHSERSYVASDQTNMQVKGSNSDAFRVSVSSAPSTSSHGSAPDDCDALGDVYIWGEVICDSVVKIGADKNANYMSTRADVLLPRPLESNVVLDVHHIACGVRHAALVTRQGEVFTWGEESGGRLGHGVGKDVILPRLVESMAFTSVDFVACGEFHSCAVTMTGELYTWGDGTHNAGLLGHGTDISHWIPKRISGPLEGLQIASVTCGPWHTALVTSTGQLFTFGDGTFGVLGHGDRENVSYPREVESLSGLRTIAVACGVWHTAAVVEVIVTQSSASVSSGKLFTWGDGDKSRLGHGDKEPRLKPTCVPALIDYNFHKIACGHSLTVGLTTSGHVFTMGSTVYGQLGNPQSDGKIPCLVDDKLTGESVEEIACGAYHVAVLTLRNEVYTWGKGANGRLGHGDVEDRKTPTLVEALKDRHVKYIACGSNYTTAICLHKWVSGAEQSQCSSCRQAFGFTRKRHNCYNCGLVHCHSCSSRKALRAALAPNPGKAYRVCDSCYVKLIKVSEAGGNNRRNAVPRLSGENKDRLDKSEIRLSKAAMPSNMDLIKQLDSKAAKQGKKADTFSLVRSSQAPSLLQLKDVLSTAVEMRRTVPKPVLISSGVSSRSVSPFSRRPSPPRSATPVPTTSGLSFSKSIADSLKKTNELLNQEVLKLRAQVDSLRHRCELQELELQKSAKKAQEAMALAAEESAKSIAAKEVIKSLTAQLKDMAERLPPGVYDTESLHLPNGMEPNGIHYADANGDCHLRSDSIGSSYLASSSGIETATINGSLGPIESLRALPGSDETNLSQENRVLTSNGIDNHHDVRLPNGGGIQASSSSVSEAADGKDYEPLQDGENGKSRNSVLSVNGNQVEAEWIEQYEPGVYITLVALRDGTRDLKRVRFSRRRFGEHQAETWWSENREKVYERYNVRGTDKASISGQAARRSEGATSPASQL